MIKIFGRGFDSLHLHLALLNLILTIKKTLINNQIKTKEVRVIDSDGKQLGIFSLEEALKMAKEKNLDLVQVTEKTELPVCKILDYGKYLYWRRKKEKEIKTKRTGELKIVRLSFKISDHDLAIQAKKTKDFFKKNHKIRIEMILRGREKKLINFAEEKIKKFLEFLGGVSSLNIERELKKEGRGLSMIISKK